MSKKIQIFVILVSICLSPLTFSNGFKFKITSAIQASFKRCAILLSKGLNEIISNPTKSELDIHLGRLSEMRKVLLLALPSANQETLRIVDRTLFILAEGAHLKSFSELAALFRDDIMHTDDQHNTFFCVPSIECTLAYPSMSAFAQVPLKYTNVRYNFENRKAPPKDLNLHLDLPNVLVVNPKHSMHSGTKGLTTDVLLHELQHIADGIKLKKWVQANIKLLRKNLSADPLFLKYVGYVSLTAGSAPILSIDKSFVMAFLEFRAYALNAVDDFGQGALNKNDLETLNSKIIQGKSVPYDGIISSPSYGISPTFLSSENINHLNFWQRINDFDAQIDRTIALAEHVSE